MVDLGLTVGGGTGEPGGTPRQAGGTRVRSINVVLKAVYISFFNFFQILHIE